MTKLNLPPVSLRIVEKQGRSYVFDRLRKRYVRLTPEEEVRQSFVSFLIEYKGYPEGLLANEVCIEWGGLTRRCDTVLYDQQLEALMVMEFKAPLVRITQGTFDQIARYTLSLPAPLLIISNGVQHFCCEKQAGKYCFLQDVPDYESIRQDRD